MLLVLVGALTALAGALEETESTTTRLVAALVALLFALLLVRTALWRVVLLDDVVEVHGIFTTARRHVLSVAAQNVDEKFFLSVWAPVIVSAEESEGVVLWSLAGYSLSPNRPNRRVQLFCNSVSQALGGR